VLKVRKPLAVLRTEILYAADKRLDPTYGNNPKSLEIYVKISPALMKTNNMKML
jgi:hypothetical protein